MKEIVFLLEEESAKAMLEEIVPHILSGGEVKPRYLAFRGKSDLQGKLSKKLASYKNPNAVFLVLRDKDSGDCMTTKDNLLREVPEDKKARTLIRIACHELESFYLGDLEAVGKGMGINTGSIINDAMYRNPDNMANAKQQLGRITNNAYRTVDDSQAIAKHMDIANNNSHSFNVLIEGIRTLIGRL